MKLYKVYSNYDPWAQNGPALGLINFSLQNLKKVFSETVRPSFFWTLYSGERLRALGLLLNKLDKIIWEHRKRTLRNNKSNVFPVSSLKVLTINDLITANTSVVCLKHKKLWYDHQLRPVWLMYQLYMYNSRVLAAFVIIIIFIFLGSVKTILFKLFLFLMCFEIE